MPDPTPRLPRIAGWTLSLLCSALLTFSATMKFAGPPDMVAGFTHLGLPLTLARPLGVLEIACVIVYLVPATTILGAVLLTGYLGGAIVTHLRVGDPIVTQVVLGVVVWGGVWLREPRLRALLPLRR
ncbi:MAG: DoxX family protein [Gemmatimonadaceae bacterium]|jgi:hypothetical protein|nr:DoxX family protein [Gemmatimonadaceae bacterium]